VRRKKKWIWVIILLIIPISLSCVSIKEVQRSKATAQLMQEALSLNEKAEKAASPVEALPFYEQARAKVDLILGDYWSDDIAARVLPVDPFIDNLDKTIVKTLSEIDPCHRAPTRSCLFSAALNVARGEMYQEMLLITIAKAQAQVGDTNAALTTAQGIKAPLDRPLAYREIAKAQVKLGDLNGAIATLPLVERPEYMASTLASIAEAQAKKGDKVGAQATFEKALAMARQLPIGQNRNSVLWIIAEAQAKVGDINSASVTAEEIGSVETTESGRAEIAKARAKLGDLNGALATLQRVGDPHFMASVLAAIAEAQAKTGDTRGAQDTFTKAFAVVRYIHPDLRDLSLYDIAKAQANAGDTQAAITTVYRMKDPLFFRQMMTLNYIGTVQIERGDIKGALAHAWQYGNINLLADIAKAQSKAGDKGGAQATLTKLLPLIWKTDYPEDRWRHLPPIAKAQAETGDVESALAIASRINLAPYRTSVLIAIAEAQFNANDGEGAGKTLKAALAATRQIKRADDRVKGLMDIATAIK